MSAIVRIATVTAAALLSTMSVGVVNAAADVAPRGVPTCQGSTFESVVNDVATEIPTTYNNTANDDCAMSAGSFGNGVVALQSTLNNCYSGNHLTQDGNFGSLTKKALENAQRAAHITPDGVYGPVTLSHLEWYDPRIVECGAFGG